MERALIIGFGSIGQRHARVLEGLGYAVSVLSRRNEGGGRSVVASLDEAAAMDYVVVANETAQHGVTLDELAARGFAGTVLVEKPLFAAPRPLPPTSFRRIGVGYNLRFHPAVRAMREALCGRVVQMAELSVGQWLGDWRPGRDVAEVYSATRAGGGGVLRDLSHELDLAMWLFGSWNDVAARGGRFGKGTVDADDGWGILLSCESCPLVTINLNYFDRKGRRTITVQQDGETWRADLVAHTLETAKGTQRFAVERDSTYAAMHRALQAGSPDVCSVHEGLKICELVEAIETAQRERRWIRCAA